jgi:hypothetical protein
MLHLGRTLCGTLLAAAVTLGTPLAVLAERPIDRTNDGAVVVLGHPPGQIATGAGTIIAQSGTTIRVVTANHVAVFGNLTIRFEDGTEVPATTLVAFPSRDLAVIEASVDPARAETLHAAAVGTPRSNEPVHIWGSGNVGPALESGAIATVGDDLPDGPANGRYALNCDTCHRGDSGGGIFDASGALVGVYVGYFETDTARLSVAEELPSAALKIARSNTSATPDTVAFSSASPAASRNTPSTIAVSAAASAAGSGTSAMLPATNLSK